MPAHPPARLCRDLRPNLHHGLRYRLPVMAALLSGSALICLTLPQVARAEEAAQEAAQESAQEGSALTLDPVLLSRGDDDARSLVASEVTSGTMMPTDVLNTASSVSVVTEKEITERGAASTEQVLQYTAGVATDYYGTDDRYDYFKIRGFDAYTYRDGLPLGENFGGIREEPFAFSRVEVLKGADSTGFGVSDPGGAVNFVTKMPTGERLRDTYLSYGSYDHKELGFDFGDSFDKAGVWSWRLTGKRVDSAAETDHSNDDEKFLMGGIAWRPDDRTTLSFVADYLWRDGYPNSGGYPTGIDFNRDAFFGEPDFNYLDTDRKTYTLKFDHDFGNGLSLGSSARYTDATSGFGYVYLGDITSLEDTTVSRFYFANKQDTEDFTLDAHLMYETQFGAVGSRTLGGVQYRDTRTTSLNWWEQAADIDWSDPVYTGGLDLDTAVPYEDKRTTTETSSAYLQQELTWGKFVGNLGLRHDWIDARQDNRLTGVTSTGDYSETTSRLGLTYRVTDAVSVYGSYAESVAPASVGTEPERGKQYELGVKYRPQGMRALFSAAVYDLTKYNMTVTDADTLQERTIGEARVRGIDLEAKAEMTERLSFTAAYSYLDSEIVESDDGTNNGNELGSVPHNAASLWMDYLVPAAGARGDLRLGLGARYTGAYWRSDSNAAQTDSAVIYDAAVSYDLTETSQLALNVSNLFDEKHVAQGGFTTDYYNAGRAVTLTLRKSW